MSLTPHEVAARNHFAATTGISDTDAIDLAFQSPMTASSCASHVEAILDGPYGPVACDCLGLEGYVQALNEMLDFELTIEGGSDVEQAAAHRALDVVKDCIRDRIEEVTGEATAQPQAEPSQPQLSFEDLLGAIFGGAITALRSREQAAR